MAASGVEFKGGAGRKATRPSRFYDTYFHVTICLCLEMKKISIYL